ncbi:hypothetical protein GCM10011374_38540 [Kocuria dechangensis]|uniref:Uncharacterized protein n=1 Tax=Kocuria dechangensis TaxID=1176249 RepID=A0A917H768_9MICC|nr:hypothetical protein GCM10011374_38540 [Kocuria dechangensis]
MSNLGAAFAAALDRGTGPADDLLFPFDHKFRAEHCNNNLTPQELHSMFSSRQVIA